MTAASPAATAIAITCAQAAHRIPFMAGGVGGGNPEAATKKSIGAARPATKLRRFLRSESLIVLLVAAKARAARGRADFRGNTRSGVVRCMHYLMRLSLVQVRSFDSR